MHLWLVWNLHLCNLCHAFMRPLPKHIEVCAYPSRSMKQMQWKPPAGICRRRLIIAIYQISAFCQEQIASGTKNPSKKELERSDQMNQFSSTGYKPQPSTNLPVSKRRNSLSLLGLRSINLFRAFEKGNLILQCGQARTARSNQSRQSWVRADKQTRNTRITACSDPWPNDLRVFASSQNIYSLTYILYLTSKNNSATWEHPAGRG